MSDLTADHDAIGQAYRAKYVRYGSSTSIKVSPDATAATLRIVAR